MKDEYLNLTIENLDDEHLCCAISDKKHQDGVMSKKDWLRESIPNGHVFRKLNARGKVFIEYSPLEKAWVPITGDNYIYIYCLWISGSAKGKGHGKNLLSYCIKDAKNQKKAGVCILSSKKKKPFLADPEFLKVFGFEVVDNIGDYNLMALSFGDNTKPRFTDTARKMRIDSENVTIYHTTQCPLINNCIDQLEELNKNNEAKIDFICVDTLEKAKEVPSVFNNWAVFENGEFVTNHLLNQGQFKKIINSK